MYETDLADIYDTIYRVGLGKDYAQEAAEISELIRARMPRAATLLDVACGTGLHLAEFASHFDTVAGVELSEAMAARARALLPAVPIHSGDMRDFDLGRQFDAVTCMFSSIGYVRDLAELYQATARMAAHLNPGGVLVLEPWFTPDQWRAGHVSHTVAQTDEITVIRMGYSTAEGRVSTAHMQYLVGVPGQGMRHFSDDHVLCLFTDDEYQAAMAAAGLVDVRRSEGWMPGRERIVGSRPV